MKALTVLARTIHEGDTCETARCDAPATHIVYHRPTRQLLCVCLEHSECVEDDSPEYTPACPNCACIFGVN